VFDCGVGDICWSAWSRRIRGQRVASDPIGLRGFPRSIEEEMETECVRSECGSRKYCCRGQNSVVVLWGWEFAGRSLWLVSPVGIPG